MTPLEHKEYLIRAQELAVSGVIFAPISFVNSSVKELLEVTDGCGARGSWFRAPKRIYGTLIIYSCLIHDFQYTYGYTIDDKHEADRVFHNNLLRLIDLDCKRKWWKPRWLMRKRARIYYLAVRECGGPAFWAGKN